MHLNKYLITFIIMAVTTLIQYALWEWINPVAYLLFYPAVLVASLYGDGISAVVLAVMISQYYFIHPQFSFRMAWPHDYLRLTIFAGSALMIRQVTQYLKYEREKAVKISEDLTREREIRERFVATLTHDLHTPLTAAKLNMQMLQRKISDPEYVEKNSEKIIRNINRMEAMIRDFLDATKIRAGQRLPLEKEECSIGSIVSSTVEDLSAIHGTRFVVEADENITGYWNASGVRRILENLCSNAIKYGADNPVTISFKTMDGFLRLSVHNEGNPIPKAIQESLFDPFIQAKINEGRPHKGWGLGLTLVKGYTEAHGGRVEVESGPETGTTFSVWLPIRGQ